MVDLRGSGVGADNRYVYLQQMFAFDLIVIATATIDVVLVVIAITVIDVIFVGVFQL